MAARRSGEPLFYYLYICIHNKTHTIIGGQLDREKVVAATLKKTLMMMMKMLLLLQNDDDDDDRFTVFVYYYPYYTPTRNKQPTNLFLSIDKHKRNTRQEALKRARERANTS